MPFQFWINWSRNLCFTTVEIHFTFRPTVQHFIQTGYLRGKNPTYLTYSLTHAIHLTFSHYYITGLNPYVHKDTTLSVFVNSFA